VLSIKQVLAPESRNAKDAIELDLKWMLTGKEKSFGEVAEVWEQHEFGLSSRMAPIVVGHLHFPVLGAV
jgi:hypothetical protein